MPITPPAIIDTHQHLWDLAKLELPWLKNAGPPLAAQHWVQQYAAATTGLNITTAMYMEVDAAADQKQREADNILALIASGESSTRCAILSANPGKDGFRKQVPIEVRTPRQTTLALRWLVDYARARREKTMTERLMNEILDASNGLGAAVKRREDTHKMAEANRAFAHYRW